MSHMEMTRLTCVLLSRLSSDEVDFLGYSVLMYFLSSEPWWLQVEKACNGSPWTWSQRYQDPPLTLWDPSPSLPGPQHHTVHYFFPVLTPTTTLQDNIMGILVPLTKCPPYSHHLISRKMAHTVKAEVVCKGTPGNVGGKKEQGMSYC